MVKDYLSWKRKDISLRESLLEHQRVKGIVKYDKNAGLKLTVSFIFFFTKNMMGNRLEPFPQSYLFLTITGLIAECQDVETDQ